MELEQGTENIVSFKKNSVIRCVNPATLESLGEVPVMGNEEVKTRIERARQAQKAWARAPFSDRRQVLRTILNHIVINADELCQYIVRESGKTLENAMAGEIWPICEKLRWTIRHGERHLRPERVSSGLLLHKKAVIEFYPLGVIGVICPFNFPLQNVLGPAIPALMAGNAVVAKVSEWTSWSAARIQKIFDETLSRSGYSPDLVQIMTGYAETGAALIHAGIDKLIFTGSVPNGKRVLAESAKTLTPVILELGGKDPMIICEDAQLDQAVHAALSGVLISSGQMCLAAERIFVFNALYDPFVDEVVRYVRSLRQGSSTQVGQIDVGAMTMPRQVEIVESLVNDAVSKGAKVLVGGKRNPSLPGHFFEPTVLTDVNSSMAIMREETFGPVMAIQRVTSEEEVVRLANETDFGLGSSIFTRDPKRAKRIASQIIAGSTVINGYGLAYIVQDLPFGGIKSSGFGRLNGKDGLRACTNIKSVLYDRFPVYQAIKMYPVKPGDYLLNKKLIEWVYGSGVGNRIRAAGTLIASAFTRR